MTLLKFNNLLQDRAQWATLDSFFDMGLSFIAVTVSKSFRVELC